MTTKTNRPLIIAFGHRARQGKNIACDAIVSSFPQDDVRVIAFADALYEHCRQHHGMTAKDAPLLQRVGQEMRQIDSEYWVSQVAAKVDALPDTVRAILLPDMRYRNEWAWVRSRGGRTVRMVRLLRDGTQFISPDRDPNHISEVDLEGWPFDAEIRALDGDSLRIEKRAVEIYRHWREVRPLTQFASVPKEAAIAT